MKENYGVVEGKKYGQLTVIRKRGFGNFWICRCSCGREVAYQEHLLSKGVITSCGRLLIFTNESDNNIKRIHNREVLKR